MKSLYYFMSGVSISVVIGMSLSACSTVKNTKINLPIPKENTVVIKEKPHLDMQQLDCMARNIFFEARGESAKGKAMVGLVVLERTQSPHFPSTVCGVVQQADTDGSGRVILNRCQFSWFCDGKDHHIDFYNPAVVREWNESYLIAKMVMLGKIKENIDMDGVTHYHNNKVNPYWARTKNFKLVARIGDHLFYRWKKAMLPKWQANDAAIAMN